MFFMPSILQCNKFIRLAKSFFILVFLVGYLLFFSLPAQAESNLKSIREKSFSQANCSQPLSLAQLTNIALNNNPATRVAWAQIKLAVANLGIAKSTYWPQINANINLTYGINNAFKHGIVWGTTRKIIFPRIHRLALIIYYYILALDRIM